MRSSDAQHFKSKSAQVRIAFRIVPLSTCHVMRLVVHFDLGAVGG
jgi:hypothetical protein